MVEVIMDNVMTRFKGLSQSVADSLTERLTFGGGGFMTPARIRYAFDPVRHLTYTGLVPRVLKTLHTLNIAYDLKDNRVKPRSNVRFHLSPLIQLRDYQEEIIERASSREVIQAATGAGKTLIGYCLIRKFGVSPTIVIVPRVDLALQIKEEFERFSDRNHRVGIIGGGRYDVQDITVCTPMSVPDDLLTRAKMILYDECHGLPATSVFDTACRAVNAYYRIGLSATPWRDGGDDLLIEAALARRKPNLNVTASRLITKGQLVPCTIVFIPFERRYEWRGDYNDLYDRAVVFNNERNDLIVDIADRMTFKEGRTTLILTQRVEHGRILLKGLMERIGREIKTQAITVDGQNVTVANVEFLSGGDSRERREAIIKAARMGFVRILIGTTIVDEGLDIPALDCLILAGGGKSSIKAFQRIGRVLRPHPNKRDAIVFDFMDRTETLWRHAMIRKALYETEPLWRVHVL